MEAELVGHLGARATPHPLLTPPGSLSHRPRAAVVGGGPAGLMAAEVLAAAGADITVIDRMRVVGRKFVMAGRSGLNITNAEPLEDLLTRYSSGGDGNARNLLHAVRAFSPEAVRAWVEGLGIETFIGTSGRVYPVGMHTTPLLRAWLRRLGDAGVPFERGTFDGLRNGPTSPALSVDGRWEPYDAIVVALGGASWPRLGGDGSWAGVLRASDVAVRPLVASNCGALVEWTDVFVERFAGAPLKNVAVTLNEDRVTGELVVTRHGLEGGPVYELGPQLRSHSSPTLFLDLRPALDSATLEGRLAKAKPSLSLSNRLRRVGVEGAAAALVRDALGADRSAPALAHLIKAVPVRVRGLAPIDRAISSAGGVSLDELDERFMLRGLPGVFACGEMLDWDAPTGGYLLQACLATGRAAGLGAAAWVFHGSQIGLAGSGS